MDSRASVANRMSFDIVIPVQLVVVSDCLLTSKLTCSQVSGAAVAIANLNESARRWDLVNFKGPLLR